MTDKEKLDDFLKLSGIELLEYQRNMVEKLIGCERAYICMSRYSGFTLAKQIMATITKK